MDFKRFDEFQQELIAEVIGMRDTKGKEYSNSADRFANFRRLSAQLGISDVQVGWVYAAKHLDAIASFAKNHQTFSSETIRGRIVDAITYLTLIAGMIQEGQNSGKHQPFEYSPDGPESRTQSELKAELELARRDLNIVLSNLRALEDLTDELENEDAAIVNEIQERWGLPSAVLARARSEKA